MKRLYSILGVDDGFRPADLEVAHNPGGAYRFSKLDDLIRSWTNRPPLSSVIPSRARQRLYFWLELHNTKPVTSSGPEPAVRRRLVEHFGPDVDRLERLVGRRPPWPEFFGAEVLAP